MLLQLVERRVEKGGLWREGVRGRRRCRTGKHTFVQRHLTEPWLLLLHGPPSSLVPDPGLQSLSD